MNTTAPILVTGASGYLGSWCVIGLLRAGRAVRATVRSDAGEAELKAALNAAGLAPGAEALTIVRADLARDADWKPAVGGVAAIVHTAAEITAGDADAQALIDRARAGTLRVLQAAYEANIPRTVFTSSTFAVSYPLKKPAPNRPLTENHWTDTGRSDLTAYVRAKTLAERAAWDFMVAAGQADRLVTICPGAIFGPLLTKRLPDSIGFVRRLMRNQIPLVQSLLPIVDVRDAADIHIRAISNPAAGGRRFIANGGSLWLAEAAEALRDRLGDGGRAVKTDPMPDDAVRALAETRPEARGLLAMIDDPRPLASTAAQALFGWSPRPARDVLVDCAQGLIAAGLV